VGRRGRSPPERPAGEARPPRARSARPYRSWRRL